MAVEKASVSELNYRVWPARLSRILILLGLLALLIGVVALVFDYERWIALVVCISAAGWTWLEAQWLLVRVDSISVCRVLQVRTLKSPINGSIVRQGVSSHPLFFPTLTSGDTTLKLLSQRSFDEARAAKSLKCARLDR